MTLKGQIVLLKKQSSISSHMSQTDCSVEMHCKGQICKINSLMIFVQKHVPMVCLQPSTNMRKIPPPFRKISAQTIHVGIFT